MNTSEKHVKINNSKRKRRKSNLWLNRPKKVTKYEDSFSFEIKSPLLPGTPICNEREEEFEHQLLQAPKKGQVKRHGGKKQLFGPCQTEQITDDVIKIIPTVVKRLQKEGLLSDFVSLLRLISEDKFALNNISFLLLLEVARWYALKTTTQMFYSDETMKFWKILYRLFHGKAVRFMSGTKSVGQVLHDATQNGNYDPQDTSINFAVPNSQAIVNFNCIESDFPKEVPPGIIRNTLQMKSKENSYILSVDGKKLAPGLNENNGDQDLFGHESSTTDSLGYAKERLASEMSQIQETSEGWEVLNNSEKVTKVRQIVQVISNRLKDLRILYQKQKMALNKFQKEAGEDWRNSRYVYAISSVQAMIYQIQVIVKRLLSLNNSLLELGTKLQDSSHMFIQGNQVDAFTQHNWISLKSPDDLPESHKTNTAFIKQRSDLWFERRNQFKITGSKIFEGIGLESLKNLQKHYDKVVRNIDMDDTVPDDVQQRMDHGTKSEINAIATLVGKVLPMYFPSLKYVEEGSHVIHSNDEPLALISPDGSLGIIDMYPTVYTPSLACEFKCPVPGIFKTPVHYEIPKRYITQILAEMAALNTRTLLYVCWTDESTTVIQAKFDEVLWQMIKTEIETIYQNSNRRPTKISDNAKNIKLKLETNNKLFTEFLCEVPSATGSSKSMSQTYDDSPYLFPIANVECNHISIDHQVIFKEALESVKESHQICRKKASEVLVWLLSDSDRSWKPEIPHAVPVAYAMKGYSLPVAPMRSMHNSILQACYEENIHVACSCFDGQWIRMATRDTNERPLTLLQLQKDVWEMSRKLSRDLILKNLVDNKIVQKQEDLKIERDSSKIVISSDLLSKLLCCISRSKQPSKDQF